MSIVVTNRKLPKVVIDRPSTAKIVISKKTSTGVVIDQNTIETQVGVIVRDGVGTLNKIEDIKNVNALNLQDKFALIYDDTTEKWVAAPNEPDNLDGGYY